MKIHLDLYGALRDADPRGWLELELPHDPHVSDLRQALLEHLATHAPQISAGLVQRSAFASSEAILAETAALPADTELAVLPPVSGG